MNELSNDGAKDQFVTYLNEDIIPVMVHCARVSVYKQHGDLLPHNDSFRKVNENAKLLFLWKMI